MEVYLDNAATSFPKPEEVYLAVEHALREIGVSPGRGGYRRALEASRLILEARENLASFFGVVDSSRVVFTHSATEALNLAVNGLLEPGDHVVTTSMEHNSLLRPLQECSRRGVNLSVVPGDERGYVAADRIAAAMRPDTKLVAVGHCSNVTGTIQPIAEIGAITRDNGTFFLVDAAQSAGSLPLDPGAMGVDLLAFPGHKGLLGPQGTGGLIIGNAVKLRPLMFGGTGSSSDSLDQPGSLPERYESGTLNLPGIAGLDAGISFLRRVGIDNVRARELRLVNCLLQGLSQIPGVSVIGPKSAPERGAVVSFIVDGWDPSEIGYLLDQEEGISVRVGLHCAASAHKTVGTYPHGTIRISPGYFNTDEDISFFLEVLHRHVTGRRGGR